MSASFKPVNSGLCVVVGSVCSVKPERQDNVDNSPVPPARLDQPRSNYNLKRRGTRHGEL
ncbi:hypothetical protein [robinz microvirus RP_40]|nr:hypothetical protein [robinz microvirus RP_40]